MRAARFSLSIFLLAAGAVVAVASFFSPGQVIHGIDAGLAGILLVGGAISLGLVALTDALESLAARGPRASEPLEPPPAYAPEAAAVGAGALAATEAAMPSREPEPEPEPEPVAEEVVAEPEPAPLEEPANEPEEPARIEIVEDVVVVEETTVETPPTEAAEDTGEAELFVVEEREFRGKPARVLSDGTVEAETDEGWMRFENMEHLEEYMDAMASHGA